MNEYQISVNSVVLEVVLVPNENAFEYSLTLNLMKEIFDRKVLEVDSVDSFVVDHLKVLVLLSMIQLPLTAYTFDRLFLIDKRTLNLMYYYILVATMTNLMLMIVMMMLLLLALLQSMIFDVLECIVVR